MSGDNQETLSGTMNKPDDNLTASALQHVSEVEVPHHTPPREQLTAQPSFEYPTREYLDNLLKPDLQKRCLELGMTNIWTNKSQLIDMILERSRSVVNNNTHQHPTTSDVRQIPYAYDDTPTHEDSTEQVSVVVLDIAKEIKIIKSKLATKDAEIELLNTEVKAAYHTINQLQQRVTELEKQHSESVSTGNPIPPSSCLLLGDNNLDAILCSDLHQSCSVNAIPGANMDLLRSWVNENLHISPANCVIYSGTSDVIAEHSPTTIIDNLGSLISDLKEKNNNMNVYVCQIVPSPEYQDIQSKIEDFNNHLDKWGETNGIKVIDTVPTFKLGTGEVDDLCFDKVIESSYSTLNRLGAVKLLNVINRQCSNFNLCPNWQEVRRSINTTQPSKQRNVGRGNTRPAQDSPAPCVARPVAPAPVQRAISPAQNSHGQSMSTRFLSTTSHRSPYRPFPTLPEAVSHPVVTTRTRREEAVDERDMGGARGSNTYAEVVRSAAREGYYAAHNHTTGMRGRYVNNSLHSHIHTSIPQTHKHYLDDSEVYQNDTYSRRGDNRNWSHGSSYQRKIGCYKCGEFNHVQAACRFDHKLLCGICQRLGHKSRLCQYYNA